MMKLQLIIKCLTFNKKSSELMFGVYKTSILHSFAISISTESFLTLLERAYESCPDILYRAIKLIQKDQVQIIRQDDINPVGLYCGMKLPL